MTDLVLAKFSLQQSYGCMGNLHIFSDSWVYACGLMLLIEISYFATTDLMYLQRRSVAH